MKPLTRWGNALLKQGWTPELKKETDPSDICLNIPNLVPILLTHIEELEQSLPWFQELKLPMPTSRLVAEILLKCLLGPFMTFGGYTIAEACVRWFFWGETFPTLGALLATIVWGGGSVGWVQMFWIGLFGLQVWWTFQTFQRLRSDWKVLSERVSIRQIQQECMNHNTGWIQCCEQTTNPFRLNTLLQSLTLDERALGVWDLKTCRAQRRKERVRPIREKQTQTP